MYILIVLIGRINTLFSTIYPFFVMQKFMNVFTCHSLSLLTWRSTVDTCWPLVVAIGYCICHLPISSAFPMEFDMSPPPQRWKVRQNRGSEHFHMQGGAGSFSGEQHVYGKQKRSYILFVQYLTQSQVKLLLIPSRC